MLTRRLLALSLALSLCLPHPALALRPTTENATPAQIASGLEETAESLVQELAAEIDQRIRTQPYGIAQVLSSPKTALAIDVELVPVEGGKKQGRHRVVLFGDNQMDPSTGIITSGSDCLIRSIWIARRAVEKFKTAGVAADIRILHVETPLWSGDNFVRISLRGGKSWNLSATPGMATLGESFTSQQILKEIRPEQWRHYDPRMPLILHHREDSMVRAVDSHPVRWIPVDENHAIRISMGVAPGNGSPGSEGVDSPVELFGLRVPVTFVYNVSLLELKPPRIVYQRQASFDVSKQALPKILSSMQPAWRNQIIRELIKEYPWALGLASRPIARLLVFHSDGNGMPITGPIPRGGIYDRLHAVYDQNQRLLYDLLHALVRWPPIWNQELYATELDQVLGNPLAEVALEHADYLELPVKLQKILLVLVRSFKLAPSNTAELLTSTQLIDAVQFLNSNGYLHFLNRFPDQKGARFNLSFWLEENLEVPPGYGYLHVRYRDNNQAPWEITVDAAVRQSGVTRRQYGGDGLTQVHRQTLRLPGGKLVVEATDPSGQRLRRTYQGHKEPVISEPIYPNGTEIVASFLVLLGENNASQVADAIRHKLAAGAEEQQEDVEVLYQNKQATYKQVIDELRVYRHWIDVLEIRRSRWDPHPASVHIYSPAYPLPDQDFGDLFIESAVAHFGDTRTERTYSLRVINSDFKGAGSIQAFVIANPASSKTGAEETEQLLRVLERKYSDQNEVIRQIGRVRDFLKMAPQPTRALLERWPSVVPIKGNLSKMALPKEEWIPAVVEGELAMLLRHLQRGLRTLRQGRFIPKTQILVSWGPIAPSSQQRNSDLRLLQKSLQLLRHADKRTYREAIEHIRWIEIYRPDKKERAKIKADAEVYQTELPGFIWLFENASRKNKERNWLTYYTVGRLVHEAYHHRFFKQWPAEKSLMYKPKFLFKKKGKVLEVLELTGSLSPYKFLDEADQYLTMVSAWSALVESTLERSKRRRILLELMEAFLPRAEALLEPLQKIQGRGILNKEGEKLLEKQLMKAGILRLYLLSFDRTTRPAAGAEEQTGLNMAQLLDVLNEFKPQAVGVYRQDQLSGDPLFEIRADPPASPSSLQFALISELVDLRSAAGPFDVRIVEGERAYAEILIRAGAEEVEAQVQPLLPALAYGTTEEQKQATQTLLEIGLPALDPLLRALEVMPTKEKSNFMRPRGAALGLAALGPRLSPADWVRVVDKLQKIISEENIHQILKIDSELEGDPHTWLRWVLPAVIYAYHKIDPSGASDTTSKLMLQLKRKSDVAAIVLRASLQGEAVGGGIRLSLEQLIRRLNKIQPGSFTLSEFRQLGEAAHVFAVGSVSPQQETSWEEVLAPYIASGQLPKKGSYDLDLMRWHEGMYEDDLSGIPEGRLRAEITITYPPMDEERTLDMDPEEASSLPVAKEWLPLDSYDALVNQELAGIRQARQAKPHGLLWVGLTGRNGSGKDTLAEILRGHLLSEGFHAICLNEDELGVLEGAIRDQWRASGDPRWYDWRNWVRWERVHQIFDEIRRKAAGAQGPFELVLTELFDPTTKRTDRTRTLEIRPNTIILYPGFILPEMYPAGSFDRMTLFDVSGAESLRRQQDREAKHKGRDAKTVEQFELQVYRPTWKSHMEKVHPWLLADAVYDMTDLDYPVHLVYEKPARAGAEEPVRKLKPLDFISEYPSQSPRLPEHAMGVIVVPLPMEVHLYIHRNLEPIANELRGHREAVVQAFEGKLTVREHPYEANYILPPYEKPGVILWRKDLGDLKTKPWIPMLEVDTNKPFNWTLPQLVLAALADNVGLPLPFVSDGWPFEKEGRRYYAIPILDRSV